MILVWEEMYGCFQNYFLLSLESLKLLTVPTSFSFPEVLYNILGVERKIDFFHHNNVKGHTPAGSIIITLSLPTLLLTAPCISYTKLDSRRLELHAHHSYEINSGRNYRPSPLELVSIRAQGHGLGV